MINRKILSTLPSLKVIHGNVRLWNFFCWLLDQADENGYAEVSVNDYARSFKVPQSTVQGWLNSVKLRSFLEATKGDYLTWVYIYHIESYRNPEENITEKSRLNVGNVSLTSGKHYRDLERKQKEKNQKKEVKKENVGCQVEKKEKKAAGATSSSSVTLPDSTSLEREEETARILPRRTNQQLKEVFDRFEAQVKFYQLKHPEWPEEGVRSFILYWTQFNQEQWKFKFEMESEWGTVHRVNSYLKQGKWLTDMAQAKLDKIKNGSGNSARKKTPTTAEIKQKEAALEEEKQEHERRAAQQIQQAMNCTSHMQAQMDPRYWIGLGLHDPATIAKAKTDPAFWKAYQKALQMTGEQEPKSE